MCSVCRVACHADFYSGYSLHATSTSTRTGTVFLPAPSQRHTVPSRRQGTFDRTQSPERLIPAQRGPFVAEVPPFYRANELVGQWPMIARQGEEAVQNDPVPGQAARPIVGQNDNGNPFFRKAPHHRSQFMQSLRAVAKVDHVQFTQPLGCQARVCAKEMS